jgi:hypothetical protein
MSARKPPKPVDKRKQKPKAKPPAAKPKPKKVPAKPVPRPAPKVKPKPPPARSSARSKVKAKPPKAPPPPASRPATPEQDAAYEAHKARARARNASISRSGRDIAPLPPVGNPERRAACERDARQFLETYFGAKFYHPWSKAHLTIITKGQQAVLDGGLFWMAAPRGSGKSVITKGLALWAGLFGHRPFIVPIGATAGAAEEILDDIKGEIETNDLLLEDFPEVVYPIRQLEGIANRCKGQLCNGERTRIRWKAREIILPAIAGSRASGTIIRVAGITGRIRGMGHLREDGVLLRPSLVLVDDIQDEDSAWSNEQCHKRERTLSGAVLGLAAPGTKIAGIATSTVIREGDVADRHVDPKVKPEWNGERISAMISFPTNRKLWDEYNEIRIASLQAGRGIADATRFYAANRAAMDEGAEAYWPERFNPDEISAVQNLMNMFFADEESFFCEMQNRPKPRQVQEEFKAEHVLAKLNRLPRGVMPLNSTRLTAFIDIQGTILYWVALATADDFTGSIVDYGAYPKQSRSYYQARDAQPSILDVAPGKQLEGAIYAALEHLTGDILTRDWKRENGAVHKIERCMIDANWGTSTNVVKTFCRQSKHAAVLLPSHGRFYGATSAPISSYTPKQGERLGEEWMIRTGQGSASRHVIFSTNHWKTFNAARWKAAMGDPGSWSIFGANPQEHRMLADHMTVEKPVEVEAKGRKITHWDAPPGCENHWLDCTVGAAVAASILGAKLLAGGGPRKKVKLSDLQKQKRER